MIWVSARKQIKASWVSLCKFWSGSVGKSSQCGLLSVEHIEQGCSSPVISWIPSGHLLTPWFLGRVKMLHVSSAMYGGAAACFQGSGSLKAFQKNVLKEFWANELVAGKQEMAASFQGAVFPLSPFL